MRAGPSLAVAVAAAAACGDNTLPVGPPLAPAADLAIVAHPDDDLTFMQPDLGDAAARGGLTTVYLTGGDGGRGVRYAEARHDGVMAAYGALTGAHDWRCGWIEIADHAAEHCRLDAAAISLVFLGYPDGVPDGSAPTSLLHLWQGDIAAATTVARRPASYDRAGLVAALAEIVATSAPATLRTLEIASTHGRDHSDHMLAGALAVLAAAASPVNPAVISYRGYDIEDEPVNAAPALYDRALDALARYHACADRCAPCGQACPADRVHAGERGWLQRRYAIGMRRRAAGQLRSGDGCVAPTSTGANAVIVDCAGAPSWQLDPGGALRSSSGLCLAANFTGEIVAAACSGLGPDGRFFLDDDGHLWSGVVPPPAADMALAHLHCVGQTGGRPRARLCGAGAAPTWELAPPTTATPRATAAIAQTGRAVRLARFAPDPLPRLCAVEPGRGLVCAPGVAGGGLGPAARLDDPGAPLAIEPESLALGDIDGDGLTDACGRDAGGLLCATAAAGYRAERWSTALAATGPASPTDRSLAIVPGAPTGALCGLAAAGVACLARGATAITDVRSAWPDRSAALWIADLDGDAQPDWCAATPGGPACGVAGHRALTSDGIAWGYAAGGAVQASAGDGAVPDTATAALIDIDDDGRADLCTLRGELIACARSTGRGFAPRATLARLPAGMVATALWAERAPAGSLPRLCAADATTIACTR